MVGSGGAIKTHEAAFVNQSTFSENSAFFGSAISNDDRTLTINNSTFTGNTSTYGTVNNSSGVSVISASVFSANNGGNCGGYIISGGYNVSTDATCPFTGRNDIIGVMAQTLPMQPNGTAPLLASSLAINNVTDPALCAGTDQLGNPRPTPCAVGALEFITAATTRYVAATGGSDADACTNPATPCATLAYALGQAATGDTIRVLSGAHRVVSLPINKSVLILGAGSDNTFLQAGVAPDRNNGGRVLDVATQQQVTLYGLTIRHGWSSDNGGGVVNSGDLVIRNSALLNNTVE